MLVIDKIRPMRDWVKKVKGRELLGFVPTMGYLHQGHLALVRRAKRECERVVVSIFVNPLQFGPGEDFDRYPRDPERDISYLEREKVDVVFIPPVEEMYPPQCSTWLEVGGALASTLEGTYRPGHFRGVCTVVGKLFNIIDPDRAYFGEKDYQQALIIKKLVKDMNFDLEVILVPTVREKDGLAASSRNTYLTKEGRKKALSLYRGLRLAEERIKEGERNPREIEKFLGDWLKEQGVEVDYAEVRDLELKEIDQIKEKVIILVAGKVEGVRLIDNLIVSLGR